MTQKRERGVYKTLTMPLELAEQLTSQAINERTSESALIRKAITKYLREQK